MEKDGQLDRALDGLWAEYRNACPVHEPSASFMPALWQKIEARRTLSLDLRRLSRRFVTAAAAICIAISCLLLLPLSTGEAYYTATYVDVLAGDSEPLPYADLAGDVQ